MMLLKADKNTKAGVLPDKAVFQAMGKYNEELVKSGAMLAGEGLQPSVKGARVQFTGGKSIVIDGPFPNTKDLIAGFWIIQANSKEEAIEWARRVPFDPKGGPATTDGNGEIEIRQLYEMADFPPEVFDSEEGRRMMEAEQAFRERAKV